MWDKKVPEEVGTVLIDKPLSIHAHKCSHFLPDPEPAGLLRLSAGSYQDRRSAANVL